jgi:O-antigen ligase
MTACLAIALPSLIAYNLPPSATFFNQVCALVGWGGFLMVLSAAFCAHAWPRSHGLLALLGALAALLLGALAAPLWAALPWALALSNVGTILAAALVALVAAALAEAGLGAPAFRAFCIGLVIAGVASAAIGIVQVYAPQWTDGNWIAHTAIEGRAVGNLRQPNHLSTLLLWAIVAAIWLGEAQILHRTAAWLIALLLLFGVVLSGSRTGALVTLTLAAWGVLDRRLSRRGRIALLLAPLAYALLWAGATEWAHLARQGFGGETRFSTGGDVSSSRFAIWSNTLALIKAHPWLGVGFGEFNFAWTLTPFPDRPVAFFDHTHDLPLQFAVELGLPLAGLVLALLAWALTWAVGNAIAAGRGADAEPAPMQRAALVMVLMVAVHSLLEYPLWYAYFLLPAGFAFGLCLGAIAPSRGRVPATTAFNQHPTRPLVLASMALVLGGMLALYDYMRVVVIFAPPAGAAPLAERIADGRRSILFAHHGDYAAATTAERPVEALSAFAVAPHYLLDARLMIAWATALDEAGDTERARYIAARLREFRNDQAESFFAPCAEAPKAGAARPFQCVAPTQAFGYEDFR